MKPMNRRIPLKQTKPFCFSEFVRHLLFSWLFAACLEYLLLPGELRALDSMHAPEHMHFARVLIVTVLLTAGLTAAARFVSFEKAERWGIVGTFLCLSLLMLIASFRWELLIFCGIIAVILTVYAITGHDSTVAIPAPKKAHWGFALGVGILSLGFCVAIGTWSVCRYLTFSTPSYDFGIFAQMFHNMRTTGLPMTTLERDGLLSHFDVHVSPIYYLMLPFYCLFPDPVTLQILQVVVIVSAVIPLWLIAKQHGLGGFARLLLCALLLVIPTSAGGVYYDLHENCFLLPLILWLMYAIDRKHILLSILFAFLTLCVKEDAAVYVAVASLYCIINAAVGYTPKRRKELLLGIGLLIGAVIWFLLVTGYLAEHGDGVMTYRYRNMMFRSSDSLTTVILVILLCPAKMLYECVDPEKITYILQTMLPLLCLPLITRKYQRYLLLIPYLLINLISDYTYQHDVLFQYNFGSSAFLLYLTVVNVADMKRWQIRFPALIAAILVSIAFFCNIIIPKVQHYVSLYDNHSTYYRQLSDALEQIPEDASVTSPTFYTSYLSEREILYDMRYCSRENLLSTEYVIVRFSGTSDFKKYETDGTNGRDNLIALLTENGYTVSYTFGQVFQLYHKAQ